MTNEEMIENLKCVIADISAQCERLKAENAALRERLDKAIELPCERDDINGEFCGAGLELSKQSCLSWNELRNYVGQGLKDFYGWHITEPKLFDEPKELSEFYIPCKWYEKGKGCPEDCALFDYDGAIDETDDFCQGKRPITRPPQSFCYVEDINEI